MPILQKLSATSLIGIKKNIILLIIKLVNFIGKNKYYLK